MAPQTTSNQPKRIAIIAASIGWGSGFESAERGPTLLFEAGLANRLQAKVIDIQAEPSMADGPLDYLATEQTILRHTTRVSDAVLQVIQEGMFPVVIGGDHTSALGFHTGLARAYGQTGILWVDTHPDLNTVETSPSGNIHGMVLAGLLGRGSEAMLQTTNACQTLDAHVAMVGVRSADAGEQRWLDEGKIHCMTMDVVREQGLETCMSNAIQTANKATAGYGLTIDIDALDPKDAPFVATPVADGLDTTDLITALASIEDSQRLLGMEVVEFTPHQDGDTAVACDLIYSLVTAVTDVTV